MGSTIEEIRTVIEMKSGERNNNENIKSFELAGNRFNTLVKEGRIERRGNQLKESTQRHIKSTTIFQK